VIMHSASWSIRSSNKTTVVISGMAEPDSYLCLSVSLSLAVVPRRRPLDSSFCWIPRHEGSIGDLTLRSYLGLDGAG